MKNSATKECRRCGETKAAADFRPNAKMRDGLSSWCASCHRAAVEQWRAANPEYQDAYNASRRIVSPEGYRLRCVVCGEEFVSRRRHAFVCGAGSCAKARQDPAKRRASYAAKNVRRQQKLKVGEPSVVITAADVRALLAARAMCPLCRKRMSDTRGHPRKKHLDHIVPLAIGGAHTVGNVRVICATCNLTRPHDGSDVDQEALWARAV